MSNSQNRKEQSAVSEQVLAGANQRAELLCYAFAAAFIIYGFSSYEFILKFKSDLTLFENVFPRIILNGLPLTLLGFFLKRSKLKQNQKAWIWSILLPMIFCLACLIYIWPLVFQGHTELYYYVHGTNIGIIALMFIITAPTPRYILVLSLSLFFFFVAPLMYLFISQEKMFTLRYIINDFLIVMVTSIYVSYQNHRLYKKVILQDVAKRNNVRKFVGKQVSEAIFENKLDSLEERNVTVAVLTLDIKGFTKLIKEIEPILTTDFMKKYHQNIARIIEFFGGSIHKTAGDGYLITFGEINQDRDLSFIPGIETELISAEERRKKYLITMSYQAANEIVAVFELLKFDFSFYNEVQISAAIDYGQISLVMIGDPKTRIEYDFIGVPVNRCSRIEKYSREISKCFKDPGSILVITEEVYTYLEEKEFFQSYNTIYTPIKDFNEIEKVYFKEFKFKKKVRYIS